MRKHIFQHFTKSVNYQMQDNWQHFTENLNFSNFEFLACSTWEEIFNQTSDDRT